MPGLLDFFKRDKAAEPSRMQRTSSALKELDKATAKRESMSVLNLGPTSANNISYFTNLGHGIYSADIATAAAEPHYWTEKPDGKVFHSATFLEENLAPAGRRFDIVLCWDVFDYIPEGLVQPLARRIFELSKTDAHLVGFFHSKAGGSVPPYHRYHIVAPGVLELQPGPPLPIQRYLNNRRIEEILSNFSAIRFLLAKDNMHEVLARK